MTAAGDRATVAPVDAVTRPILPSADLLGTAGFYAPFGFELTGHWADEYAVLRGPDSIELHFWYAPNVGRWTNDVSCWIGYPEASGVRARHEQWAAVDMTPPGQLTAPKDDGRLLEFQLIDLYGNLLRLGSPSPTRTA